MCLMPENELPVILPPRRSHTLAANPGRYGVDPAPVSAHDGEPLTRIESFKFLVPVWCACGVLGLVVGLIFGVLKA